jgi:hypothetical protein
MPKWYGTDWIVFKATDSNGLNVTTNNITLTVTHVNHNPVLLRIRNVNVLAGGMVQITPQATDEDNENMTFTFTNPLNSTGGWETSLDDIGLHTVTVSVRDVNGGSDSQEVTINVFQKIFINEFLASHTNSSSSEDWVEIYNPINNTIDLANCDLVDGANNTLSLTGTLNGATKYKAFDWTNRLNNDGDVIKLYCYDTLLDSVSYGNWDDGNVNDNAVSPIEGKSIGRTQDGDNTNNNLNDFKIFDMPTKELPNNYDMIPPSVDLIEPLNNALFNRTRDITFGAKPIDNSNSLNCELYLNGVSKQTKQATNNTETTFSLTNLDNGNYTWNVKCLDSAGNSAFSLQEWSFVINAPYTPRMIVPGSQTVSENENLNFEVNAIDQDGDTNLTFSTESLPVGAEFNSITRKFSWTPSYEQAGNYNVKFKVKDSNDLEGNSIVVINVRDVKKPANFSDVPLCSNKTSGLDITIKNPKNNEDFTFGESISGKVSIKNDLNEDLDLDLKFYLYDGKDEKQVEREA